MPYYEKRIYSGDLLEVRRYYATPRGGQGPRRAKERETTERQSKLNDRYSFERLYRLTHANFVPGKDLFVTLTHAEQVDEKTARRAIKNYIERVRHYRRKNGLPELKYIVVTEKQGQWHHHIIMNAMPMDAVFDLWGEDGGRNRISKLDSSKQYKDLARYLIAEEKPSRSDPAIENAKEPRRKNARRWSSSRNLDKPIETEPKEIKRETIMRRKPIAPSGYYLLPEWTMGCDGWGNLYQSFACEKIKKRQAPPRDTKGTKSDGKGKGRSQYRKAPA